MHCSFYSCNAAHLLQLLRWRRGPLATAKFRGSNTEHLLQLLRWRRGPPAAVTSHGGETLTHPHHPTLLPSRRRAMLPPKEVLAYKANSSLAIIVHHLRIFHCHTMHQLALSLQLILFAACIILACFIRTSSLYLKSWSYHLGNYLLAAFLIYSSSTGLLHH